MQKVFRIPLTGDKSEILKKVNTYKGLYGVLGLPTKNLMFKLVSARELKKDSSCVSVSLLVQKDVKDFNEKKWSMVRLNANRNGDVITVLTYADAMSDLISANGSK